MQRKKKLKGIRELFPYPSGFKPFIVVHAVSFQIRVRVINISFHSEIILKGPNFMFYVLDIERANTSHCNKKSLL